MQILGMIQHFSLSLSLSFKMFLSFVLNLSSFLTDADPLTGQICMKNSSNFFEISSQLILSKNDDLLHELDESDE